MSSSTRIWRGQTLEARSADRREQLIQAAFELMGTQGAAAVTMRAVCRGAQLSPRYFYESFPDRETLLLAVFDRAADEMREAAVAAVAAAPGGAAEKARAAFDVCMDLFEVDPRRGRVLFREALADRTLRIHAATVLPVFVAFVAAQLSPADGGLLGMDEAELQLTYSSLSGALMVPFLAWLDGRLVVSRKQLVDHCVRLFTTTLETVAV